MKLVSGYDNDVVMLYHGGTHQASKRMVEIFQDTSNTLKDVPELIFGSMDIYNNDVEGVDSRGIPYVILYPKFPKIPKIIKYDGP